MSKAKNKARGVVPRAVIEALAELMLYEERRRAAEAEKAKEDAA